MIGFIIIIGFIIGFRDHLNLSLVHFCFDHCLCLKAITCNFSLLNSPSLALPKGRVYMMRWNPDTTNPYITNTPVLQTIFFSPLIVKYMGKEPNLTSPH